MSANIHLMVRLVVQMKGENFLGPGRIELMEGIQKTGSIAEAAREMDMSYRKALNLIEHMNGLYGKEVVLTWKGGQQRGGARLSAEGEALLARYKALCTKMEATLAEEGVVFLP